MNLPVVIMNFTHVYEEEFSSVKNFAWINCTDLSGTDCYCDKESEQILKKRMDSYSPHGIHFIDSGNYHYITKFWTDKIKEPFSLILFDHHPDMQPSLFENLISCGCWVKDLLDSNCCVKKICIIGASEKLMKNVPAVYYGKLIFFGEHYMDYEKEWSTFYHLNIDTPVYISIDKDVLNKESAVTNWDQGSMSLDELEKLLFLILKNKNIIGIDICGECGNTLSLFEREKYGKINGNANRKLLKIIYGTL